MVPGAQKDMMEPVRLTLKPGGTSDIYLPHEGEEFGYVLKGSIKIIYGTRTYTARQGESFYLKSNKKHHIENTGRKDAVLIWVTNPPSFQEVMMGKKLIQLENITKTYAGNMILDLSLIHI